MFVGKMLGNEQREHQIDGLLVDGVEIDALSQFDKSADGSFALLETAMGQGDPMAQTRATQTLTPDQGVENGAGRQFGVMARDQFA